MKMLRYSLYDTASRQHVITFQSSVIASRMTDRLNHACHALRWVVITIVC